MAEPHPPPGGLFDPVHQAEQILTRHHHDRRHTHWTWYCRLCGAEGETTSRATRDADALTHAQTRHGHLPRLGWLETGTLAHIWRY